MAVYATPNGKYYGTTAMITVHGIHNIKPGQFSGAYIVVENAVNGAPDQTNAIIAGWLVSSILLYSYLLTLISLYTYICILRDLVVLFVFFIFIFIKYEFYI